MSKIFGRDIMKNYIDFGYVVCDTHGAQCITEAYYDNQMDLEDEWKCPICGEDSYWSDETMKTARDVKLDNDVDNVDDSYLYRYME